MVEPDSLILFFRRLPVARYVISMRSDKKNWGWTVEELLRNYLPDIEIVGGDNPNRVVVETDEDRADFVKNHFSYIVRIEPETARMPLAS